MNGIKRLPDRIRLSMGTAAVLGLEKIKVDVASTTAYLMLYSEHSCTANCAFCAQARESSSDRRQLSRVVWPDYDTREVISALKESSGQIQRVCIQINNYAGFIDDVVAIIHEIKTVSDVPISIDTCPIRREDLERIREVGAERISIPLDAATSTIFDAVKGNAVGGPYRWETHFVALEAAIEVYGRDNVMTNLIIGLGETEREAVEFIQCVLDRGVKTALFAFTPIHGTPLQGRAPPQIDSYRRIQLTRNLITSGRVRSSDMRFDADGRIIGFGVDESLKVLLGDGEALRTTGCPGCNRPFYNERPRGPMYNYPQPLTPDELAEEIRGMERALTGIRTDDDVNRFFASRKNNSLRRVS
jgi:biotin synthase